jgi:hypothetical protein
MHSKWKLVALLSLAVLLVGATACDDDDDDMETQQVSSDQAELLIAQVLPDTLELSLGVLQVLQSIQPPPPAPSKSAAGQACPPIPGFDTTYLCTNPNTGLICDINATTSELQFNMCDADGTSLDGVVTVVGPDGGPYDLDFELTANGQSVSGAMNVAFGATCDSLSYDSLTLSESGITSTLVGDLESCSGVPDGDLNVTVNASGFQPFVADVSFTGGFATIVVVDGATQAPLYLCTWSPLSPDTADCQPYPA